MEDAHEVSQCESVVGHHALYLMELGQVGGVQGLVPEHPVDGEILDGGELLLVVEQTVGHVGGETERKRSIMVNNNTCAVYRLSG